MKKESVRQKTELSNKLKIKGKIVRRLTVGLFPLDLKRILILILLAFSLFLSHSSPFVSASHGVSRAPGMSASIAREWDIGEKTAHCSTGTTTATTTKHSQNKTDTVDDKYFSYCNLFSFHDCNVTEFEIFYEQAKYFENSSLQNSSKGVKGSLKKHIQYWKEIGASEFILDTISDGYIIPFSSNPPSMCFKNNKSAFNNHEFVDTAIADLVNNGCAIQVPFKPYVVSPLSVATQKSGKKRLILDLSVLNKFVRKDKFKFEDWKVATQLFSKDCYC